jgi:hypothetical protein
MQSNEETKIHDERDRYEPPAVAELGTVAALTQVSPVCTYPSQCA